jgi:hypothetical protein
MQLDTYVEQVQDQLSAAAALGDDRVREVAATLASAAAPAVRLALLGALAAAADEITAALLDSPGAPAVAVHLDTDEIRIAVTTGATEPTQPPRADDGDTSARISLRLSEGLKTDIDAAATRAGVSVNTWLVRAATTALGSASGDPHSGTGGAGGSDRRGAHSHHVTGWING